VADVEFIGLSRYTKDQPYELKTDLAPPYGWSLYVYRSNGYGRIVENIEETDWSQISFWDFNGHWGQMPIAVGGTWNVGDPNNVITESINTAAFPAGSYIYAFMYVATPNPWTGSYWGMEIESRI
jgi:hypothetical protein